jgi:hypothetical protein
MEMREALQEKEDAKNMKAKMREKVSKTLCTEEIILRSITQVVFAG